MPRLVVDGRPVEVAEGASLLDALRAAGADVPTLCHIDGRPGIGSCGLCVVRDIDADQLRPSCAAPAREGMNVETGGERVRRARRAALALLLSEHAGDCRGPCHRACPAGLDVPRAMGLCSGGSLEAAALWLRAHLPLAGVLSRLCPAPCKKVCRRGRLEEAVNVPGVLGFAAALGTPADLARREGSGKTVMVVGAGPAGLSAAFHLAREGHDCTVLDERETAGGMLLHGPEKLPREVLERDIDFIVAAGVSLRLDTRIAEQRDLERLSEGTDAVVVATGDLGADGAARFGFPSSEPGTAPAPVTGQTARAGFFTAGRGATPGRSVARAVGRGRAVAGAVHQYLVGRPSPRLTTRTDARLGRLTDSERGVLFQGVESRPSCKTDDHDAVRKEAGRCLRCDCAQSVSCRLRALADDYEVEPSRGEGMRRPVEPRIVRDGLSFEPGKCIRCGICVRILENAGITSGLAFAGRGFNLAVVPPFSDPSLLDFKGQARECARLCPTGALVMLREGP